MSNAAKSDSSARPIQWSIKHILILTLSLGAVLAVAKVMFGDDWVAVSVVGVWWVSAFASSVILRQG